MEPFLVLFKQRLLPVIASPTETLALHPLPAGTGKRAEIDSDIMHLLTVAVAAFYTKRSHFPILFFLNKLILLRLPACGGQTAPPLPHPLPQCELLTAAVALSGDFLHNDRCD